MSLGVMDPATSKRFDAFCREISSRGQGITLGQIGDAAALARELSKDRPDEHRVREFRQRLGIQPTSPAAQAELEL